MLVTMAQTMLMRSSLVLSGTLCVKVSKCLLLLLFSTHADKVR